MDKISGIVASSPRVTAVDMKESSPVRPGVPAFGRMEGVSSLKDGNLPTSAPKAAAVQGELVQWKNKDAQHAALVTELSNNFFGKSPKPMEKAPMPSLENESAFAPNLMRETASSPAGFKTDGVGSLRAATPRSMAASMMDDEFDNEPASTKMQQPEGLFPKGSFIDRAA